MSVTDLTNTKWILNATQTLDVYNVGYSINFISNSTNYVRFGITAYRPTYGTRCLRYDDNQVYWNDSQGWTDVMYRVVDITGGTDATNTDLITWFETNAVQSTITDLSNTSWIMNDVVQASTLSNAYHVYFRARNKVVGYEILYFNISTQGSVVYTEDNAVSFLRTVYTVADGWDDLDYQYITFTTGEDIANAELINWLLLNATLDEANLENTTWLLNTKVYMPSTTATYDINFTDSSETATYTQFKIDPSNIQLQYYYSSSWTTVYSNGWTNNQYKTIHIIDGDDAHDENLYAWLKANAIQLKGGMYIGSDDVACAIKKMYIGVGGKARKVVKGYIGGPNNKARLFLTTPINLTNTYCVAKTSGYSYGFVQCADGTTDSYYYDRLTSYDSNWLRSNNYHVSSSTARSTLTFTIEKACTVVIELVDYVNESSYDYGTIYDVDSSSSIIYNGSSNHIEGGSYVAFDMSVGTHTIIVQYRKDSSLNNANDRLYFRVNFDGVATPPTSVTS